MISNPGFPKRWNIIRSDSYETFENIVNTLDKAMSKQKINNNKFAFSSNTEEKAK